MILLTEERYRNRIRKLKEIVYCVDPIEASRLYWEGYEWALAKKRAKKGYFRAGIEMPPACNADEYRWITIKFSDYEKKELKDSYQVTRKFFFEFGFDMSSLAKRIEGIMWKYIAKLDKEFENEDFETDDLFLDILYESGVLRARYIVNFDLYFTVWTSKDRKLTLDHAITLERKSGVFDYGNVKFGREDIIQWDDHWEELVNEYVRDHIDTLLERAVNIVEKKQPKVDDEVVGEEAIKLLNSIVNGVDAARLFFWAVSDHLFYYTYQWTMEFLIDILKRKKEKEGKSVLGMEWLWSDSKL
jgi:hypothetical protein